MVKKLFKMAWLAVCILTTAVYGGGGVTKTSGIDQFWTDDYKIFDQVYGKTSDKEIYGATLPPSVNFDANTKIAQASEKKEQFLINYQQESDVDPYLFSGYNKLQTKPLKKQATSSINFVSYNDFKPISQSNDPETYSYLKHLEEQDKENFPKGAGGFKPYLSYAGTNTEDDAYKSIQDILDTHEANKVKTVKQNANVDAKYLNYGKGKGRKPSRAYSNDMSKPRCVPGRCRKRSTSSYRVRTTRPYYRRIKHRGSPY